MSFQRRQADELVMRCFLQPQFVLSERDRNQPDSQVRLDFVSLLAVKLLSKTPVSGLTMSVDPLLVKLGFSHDWRFAHELSGLDLEGLFQSLRGRDNEVGCWTMVHDVKGSYEEKQPRWRVVTEVSPSSVISASWFPTDKKVLTLDVEGAAVFMGLPPKK